MKIHRRRLLYEGQVQGVGFRMTARRLATAFPLSGYVRNRDDGRVELVVEGELPVVTSYLQAIQREFADAIESVQEIEASSMDEPLAGFTIRF